MPRLADARPRARRRRLLPVRTRATALPASRNQRKRRHGGSDRVATGQLDAAAVEAVLHAAGHRAERPKVRPGGLTPREIEVLCLVARGASNKEIAKTLVISEKTARNHVERTYAKIGVSNRIGASMYALKHGLVNPVIT